MAYDPRSDGADCARCPLRADRIGPPVPSERKGVDVLIVGEAPAKNEVRLGRPFVGASGRELEEGLNSIGLTRGDVDLTNILACPLPPSKARGGSDFVAYLNKCSREGLPSPVECCAPRLERELAGYTQAVVVGDGAARAVLRVNKGITTVRGGPFTVEREGLAPLKVMPTFHPAHVLRQARWRATFRGDLARAWRFFNDQLDWEPFDLVVWPDYEYVVEWFTRALEETSTIAYDVETDSKYPLRARLRCIGFSTPTSALVVPFLSVDGLHRFYTDVEERRIVEYIRSLVRREACVWAGHNEGWYDRIVLEKEWGFRLIPHYDTIIGHRSGWPYMPHDLGTVTTTLTDASAWKATEAGHKISKLDIEDLQEEWGEVRAYWPARILDGLWAFKVARRVAPWRQEADEAPAEEFGEGPEVEKLHRVVDQIVDRDGTLLEYNARDNIAVSRIEPIIRERVHEREQDVPCTRFPDITIPELADHCQDFCVNLHRQGVYIDQERRGRAEQWLRAWSTSLLKDTRQALAPWWNEDNRELLHWLRKVDADDDDEEWGKGFAPFNPNSTRHKRILLYKLWELDEQEFTLSGDASTADKILRAHLLQDMETDDPRADGLYAMRKFVRVNSKWLGTYVAPFARHPVKAAPTKRDPFRTKPVPSKLYPDGRVRAQWNAHGTPVWRYSASDPGLQTIPPEIKPMYTAAPGHILAGADADQIHLRIIACLWDVAYYKECFAIKGDPHATGAYGIFGDLFRSAQGFPGGKWVGPVFVPDGQGKWSGKAKELRQLAKVFIYAFAYGADVNTIWKVLIRAEDGHGRLAMRALTERKVGAMREELLKRMPEFERGWALEVELAEENGARTGEAPWLADPLAGVRIDFPGGTNDPEEVNKIRNARVLTTEAIIMHMAERRLLEAMPFGYDGPGTGPIIQVHDSLSVEVTGAKHGGDLEAAGKRAAGLVAEAITMRIPGWEDVPFTASGTFGQSLLEA